MAKTVQYVKDSVIYLDGQSSNCVYVLQEGSVSLSYTEPGNAASFSVDIKQGEMFGVKDLLMDMPHHGVATATSNSTIILLTIDEFKRILENDHRHATDILRSFSMQLKYTHDRLEEKFDVKKETDCERGLYNVAAGFFSTGESQLCVDVCERFLSLYETSDYRERAKELLKSAWSVVAEKDVIPTPMLDTVLDDFEGLEMFERFKKTIPPQQLIFAEFEKGDSFYLMRSGVVRSSKCIQGMNITTGFLAPGDFFGLNGFMDENIRTNTCVSTGSVEALEFSRDNLESIISANPKIAFAFLRLMAKRIKADEKTLKNMAIADSHLRVRGILTLFDELGFCERLESGSKKLYLNVHDISVWANIPEDDVKRELEVLSANNLLKLYEKFIVIKKSMN